MIETSSPVEAAVGQVTGLGHYGIQVADLERSVAFYEALLGTTAELRWVKDNQTVQDLVGYPGLEVHGAALRVPGSDVLLEILEYRNVDRAAIDPATANPGTAHVCFYVDDLPALYERLRERGVEFISPPLQATSAPWRRVVYLIDPDGIRVELLQSEANLLDEPR
jgi:catechol 2,3-dioxygenase-like lactoylglutathione lyase family enzyme